MCALRGDRDKAGPERITHQARQAVVWRGFDENLEQGARCSRQPTTHNVRACLWKILQRNFPHRRSSRCQNMTLPAHGLRTSNLQTNEDKQATSYSKHTSWKKNEHFSDVGIQ
jgi:hypothetical protein